MDRKQLEKQGVLLDKLTARRKALENYQKAKRKAAMAMEEKNGEKLAMTRQCEEKRKEDCRKMAREQRQKEAKVRKNLQEAETERLADLQIKKEH